MRINYPSEGKNYKGNTLERKNDFTLCFRIIKKELDIWTFLNKNDK